MNEETDPIQNLLAQRAERIAYLIAGHLRQTLSEGEKDELDEWISSDDKNQRLFEEMVSPYLLEQNLKEYDKPDEAAALKRIKEKLRFSTPVPTIQPNKKRMLLRWSIAASVIVLTGLAIYFVTQQPNNTTETTEGSKPDIAAGGNRATLTLADGSTIDLATAKNGLMSSSDGPDVLKTAEGQISYEEGKETTGKGSHVLSTPAGGQYAVTLPDGTRVWLNARSSLKYPVVFDERERIVELEGEGYFEVAPSNSPQGGGQTKIPFVVKVKGGMEVEVVGTHFNINAYEDEGEMKTTLLEGKVVLRRFDKLSAQDDSGEWSVVSGEQPKSSNELKPGEQLIIDRNGKWRMESGVDTGMVTAWKNGKFQFKDATIEAIMKQVARWYDAEIVYEGRVDYHFNATIYRKENVSKLLELLEGTGRVRFSIEGRKIVVRP
ncbi:MAG: FecR domain-containing protein [Chitinophagaceae bacterium]|nr:FecR domain-containing protein [Chitinophagaceae bacterium]